MDRVRPDDSVIGQLYHDKAHIYTPLKQDRKALRLLTVFPAHFQEEIQCRLDDEVLGSDCPAYETISYCWRDPTDQLPVAVNGLKVLVPASSASAIRRVRNPAHPRTIWLDAICINQDDKDERGHQVAMMRDVYSQGVRNFVYLGEDNLEAAFRDVEAIVLDCRRSGALERIALFTTDGSWFDSNTIMTSFSSEAIENLLSQPWFWRVWTMQEAILARNNVCVSHNAQIDLNLVVIAASILRNHYHFISQHLSNLCWGVCHLGIQLFLKEFDPCSPQEVHRMHNTISKQASPSPLHGFELVRSRNCCRQVDKIYGSLGLQHHVEFNAIIPDYTLSKEQVFVKAAAVLISVCRNLELLNFVYYASSPNAISRSNLPSWVPDWSQDWDGEKHSAALVSVYCADDSTNEHWSGPAYVCPEDQTRLMAFGIDLGSLASKLDFRPPEDLDDISTVRHFVMNSLTSANSPDSATEEMVAFILCGGHSGAEADPYAPDNVRENYRAFLESLDLNGSANAKSMRYDRCMFEACYHRSLLTTRDGRIGIGPDFSREGDIVVILHGMNEPVVLRPCGDEFLFLGVAYIYGVMHGEAVQAHFENGGKAQLFKIR